MPPTIQELGARIGVSSTGSAHQLVWALIRKGYVTRDRYKWRSLRVVGDPVLVSIPVALPEEVATAVKWHAARLCGGNVNEMVARIVAGWAACNAVPRDCTLENAKLAELEAKHPWLMEGVE